MCRTRRRPLVRGWRAPGLLPCSLPPPAPTRALSHAEPAGRPGAAGEALAASQEAAAIRRELAAARPDAFRPDLAMALNNLSACLGDLGRREEALAASQEAAAIYRQLAAARPDAFRVKT
jgi:tetratricopeptide (TPR) repeat protein